MQNMMTALSRWFQAFSLREIACAVIIALLVSYTSSS